MANTGVAPVDLGSNVGKVRVLLGDTDPTNIVAGEGVYSVDPETGEITFDPEPTFVGQATGVTYVVADQFGETAFAAYTPTVTAPPNADDDIPAPGPQGVAQVIDVLANDDESVDTESPFDPLTLKLCQLVSYL